MIKLSNSLDEIYEKGIVESPTGKMMCSVCWKEYKNQRAAEKHIKKRNCHTFENLFRDTAFERMMFELYKKVSVWSNRKHLRNVGTFRDDTKMYNAIAKFMSMCHKNEIDVDMYTEYLFGKYAQHGYFAAQILAFANREDNIEEFRKFLRLNPEYIPSSDFIEKNRELLESDLTFLHKSLNKAHVDLATLLREVDVNTALTNATQAERYRFERLLDKLEDETLTKNFL